MDKQIFERESIPSGIIIVGVGGGGKNIVAKAKEMSEYNIAEAICEDDYDLIHRTDREDIKLVIIIACLGGNNGFKSASVIANYSKSLNIQTICLTTIPFRFEGDKKIKQAILEVGELTSITDQMTVINNQSLVELYGNLSIAEAFSKVDNIMAKNLDCVIGSSL